MHITNEQGNKWNLFYAPRISSHSSSIKMSMLVNLEWPFAACNIKSVCFESELFWVTCIIGFLQMDVWLI